MAVPMVCVWPLVEFWEKIWISLIMHRTYYFEWISDHNPINFSTYMAQAHACTFCYVSSKHTYILLFEESKNKKGLPMLVLGGRWYKCGLYFRERPDSIVARLVLEQVRNNATFSVNRLYVVLKFSHWWLEWQFNPRLRLPDAFLKQE